MRGSEGTEPRSALRVLGEELARARARAGMSQEALAQTVSYSSSLIAMVEVGKRVPSSDLIKRVDETLGTDGILSRLLDLVRQERVQPAWFLPWAQVEQAADLILWYEVAVIPGLLQTEAYARTILAHGGLLSPAEVEEQVSTRLARQEILDADPPTQLVAVIDEMALTRRAPDAPGVVRDQLEQLASRAEQPHVSIHVIPSGVGLHAGLAGPMILARGEDGTWTGHLDSPLRAQCVDAPKDIGSLHRYWECLRGEALPRKDSLEMIKKLAMEAE